MGPNRAAGSVSSSSVLGVMTGAQLFLSVAAFTQSTTHPQGGLGSAPHRKGQILLAAEQTQV